MLLLVLCGGKRQTRKGRTIVKDKREQNWIVPDVRIAVGTGLRYSPPFFSPLPEILARFEQSCQLSCNVVLPLLSTNANEALLSPTSSRRGLKVASSPITNRVTLWSFLWNYIYTNSHFNQNFSWAVTYRKVSVRVFFAAREGVKQEQFAQ